MISSTQVGQEQIDYRFLLLTHIICADQQIHSKELEYLEELGDRTNISQQTKDEIDKIFTQDRQHITINHIANSVSIEERLPVHFSRRKPLLSTVILYLCTCFHGIRTEERLSVYFSHENCE